MGPDRSWLVPLVGSIGWGVSGCASPPVRYADVQMDITGAGLADTDRVRVCVDGVRVFETALGSGTIGMTQLPGGTSLAVTVDHIVDEMRLGRAGPVVLDQDTPHVTEPWQDCTEDCGGCSIENDENEATADADHLLTIRFLD